MKIAISGCGITGTAAAILLSRAGHDVTIFEQAASCGPVGAGIMLQPSGQMVLKRMGLLERAVESSQKLDGMTAMRSCGKRLIKLSYDWIDDQTFAYGVHRGRLFEILYEACVGAGVRIVNRARVIGCKALGDAASKVQVETENSEHEASQGDFDFLIGADGSKSKLREISSIKSKVHEYEFAALWMTGKSDFQPNELYQLVKGTSRLVGLLPIGLGECSYFWGLTSNEYRSLNDTGFEAWREQAIELCPQSSSILQGVTGFEAFTFSGYRHVTMKSYGGTEGILFMGDAAHATSPHLGQGVNLGLEDAECFSNCLKEFGDFRLASSKFEKLRIGKLRYYQRLTKTLSPFFQSHGKMRGVARNLALPWLPAIPYVRKQMLRTLCGTKNGWLG